MDLLSLVSSSPASHALYDGHGDFVVEECLGAGLLYASIFKSKGGSYALICSNQYAAQRLYEFLLNFLDEESVIFFPADELLRAESVSSSKELLSQRLYGLGRLLTGGDKILVTHPSALLRYLPDRESFRKACIKIEKGGHYDLSKIKSRLVELGYEGANKVDHSLQFASRGDILDVYSVSYPDPIRIEFFDDEVESIRFFDVAEQESKKEVDSCLILPSSDIFLDDEGLQELKQELSRKEVEALNLLSEPLQQALKANIDDAINKFEEHDYQPYLYKYFALVSKPNSVLSYFSPRQVYFCNHQSCLEAIDMLQEEANGYLTDLALSGECPFSLNLYIPLEEVIDGKKAIYGSPFATKQGAYVFTINDPGSADTDIALVKTGVPVEAATYRVKVWAKSSANTYAHLLAKDEASTDGSFLGGAYNLPITTSISPLELEFEAPAEGTVELRLNLGSITPNPDNPEDTTPDNFTVTIDKIELYKITGEQTQTPVYTADFASADAVTVTAGDGASATATAADGAGTFQIDAYPTADGGVWSIKADMALPGITLTAGEKYYYSFTIQADSAQSAECLVESASQADAARANFNSIAMNAGEELVVTNVFDAEASVEDPVIRLQLGTASEGVTSNKLTVTNLEFGTVSGDLDTEKTIDYFGESIAADASPDLLWTVYNGTDEDNETGVGTIWTENGSLFYRIDQGGTVDWHNKLIFGHSDDPLTLPADSYFTVQITAKASQPVSCGFYLNPLGGWDPRISEAVNLTTEEQTFTFETTDPLITDMDFEMLFQFGSAETAALGEVTVEISDITILQRSVA